MRILLTHRYFVPDSSPYGMILHQMAKELAADGHDIAVFSSQPSYRQGAAHAPRRETLGDILVRRVWVLSESRRNPLVRGINLGIYCISLFFHVIGSRADVVTAGTFPPVLAAWSASLAARLSGRRFIYHVQDIHPEVSVLSGARLGRGLPMRILRRLDNQTLRRAQAIVTLSLDMAETLRSRNLGNLPIHVINNPPLDAEETLEPPAELRKPSDTVRVIFAGNLGRFQNLPLLAEGIAKCFNNHPELELLFLGDGVALPELRTRWGDHPQVRFAPFLPFAQAREIISGSDIGLVSLSPNLYRVAYPSKIATYLELGLRLLALVEPESQLASELERLGVGVVPHEGTPHAIAAALEALLAQPATAVAAFPNQLGWPALIARLDEPTTQSRTNRCF